MRTKRVRCMDRGVVRIATRVTELLFRITYIGCFGLAWTNARCPTKPLYHSPSSTGQGRGNMMKGSRVEIRTGRDHSPTAVMDKTG